MLGAAVPRRVQSSTANVVASDPVRCCRCAGFGAIGQCKPRSLFFVGAHLTSGARGVAVPVRVTGMIGVTPPTSDASLHVIEGGLSPAFLAEFARAHDAAGFDMALVGYSSSSAEGFLVALYAAMQTERLGYLVAHRPGFVAPTLLARKS